MELLVSIHSIIGLTYHCEAKDQLELDLFTIFVEVNEKKEIIDSVDSD